MIRILIAVLLLAAPARAEVLRMAVTTSFVNSGLAEVLLPEAEAMLDLDIQLLVVGTGQALRLGAAGDVDAVLVHSRAAEDAFVAAGHAPYRREIMYNDFVLIGPEGDPAGAAGAADASGALARIADARAPFVSRGDDSGTHMAEMRIWGRAGIVPDGRWYRPIGGGMGAALNAARGMGAYVLSDRASWLNFGNRDGLALLFEGDPVLFNQYAYLPVDPDAHPSVNAAGAARLEAWLVSDAARGLIDGYRIDGERLFTFNATPRD